MPRLGEAFVEITANTAGFDAGIARVHTRTIDAMNSIDQRAGQLEGSLEKLHRTIARAFSFVVVYEGLHQALSGIRKLIDAGLQFDRQMQTAKISFASAFMQHMDFKTTFGQAVTGIREMNAALGLSEQAMKKLEYANLRTTATLQDLVKAYSEALPAGMQLGLTWQQTMEVTTRMMRVAGAMGWDTSLMGQELRELLRGNVTTRSPLSAIFSTEEMQKVRGNAQATYDLINRLTSAYKITGDLTEKSFEGIWSNLKSMFSQAAGMGLQTTLFQPMQALMTRWLNYIVTINDKTHSISFNPDFIEKFRHIGDLAMSLVNAFSEVASQAIDIGADLGQWSGAVTDFGSALSSAFGIMGQMLRDTTEVKNQLEEIAKLIPATHTAGVPGATAGGLIGALLGYLGKLPLVGAGLGGAGVGLGLGTGYEALEANRKKYSKQNTLEAMIGLGGAGALAGGMYGAAGGPVGMEIGALTGGFIGVMTSLLGSTIDYYGPGAGSNGVTAKMPPWNVATPWIETAKGAGPGFVAMYGAQWNEALKNLTPQIESDIDKYSRQYNVPARVLRAILGAESGFRQFDQYGSILKSPKGALGIGQLMPGTASELGVNALTLTGNIQGSAKYLSELMAKFHDNLKEVIAAYNAGPRAVASAGGVPPYAETLNYVSRVMGYMGLQGMAGPQITAIPKIEYHTFPEGQLAQNAQRMHDSLATINRQFTNQQSNLAIDQAKKFGMTFIAQVLEIEKKIRNEVAGVWKGIEGAQTKFQAEQKQLAKQGISPDAVQKLVTALATPGEPVLLKNAEAALNKMAMAPADVAKLESSIRALFGTWKSGLSLIDYLQGKVADTLTQDAREKILQQTAAVDKLRTEYVKLTGTIEDQYRAEAKLISAQEKAGEAGKSNQEIALMRQIAHEKTSTLNIQANGSFTQNLFQLWNDQMRNMQGNAMLAQEAFSALNNSIDMTNSTLWDLIGNVNHVDDNSKLLSYHLRELATNILSQFGQMLTKQFLTQYVMNPAMHLLEKVTGASGAGMGATASLTELATAAHAAATALYGLAGTSAPAGVMGPVGSSLFGESSGVWNFLAHVPLIGGLFQGLATSSMAASVLGGTGTLASGMIGGQFMGAFASGGITSGPSLAGENGPEAVVPLPGGRAIPVSLRGNAGSTHVINVNVKPTDTKNTEEARRWGQLLGEAIQAKMNDWAERESRPGGRLNPFSRPN